MPEPEAGLRMGEFGVQADAGRDDQFLGMLGVHEADADQLGAEHPRHGLGDEVQLLLQGTAAGESALDGHHLGQQPLPVIQGCSELGVGRRAAVGAGVADHRCARHGDRVAHAYPLVSAGRSL